jgi:phospholipid/cholesterol/gamma-HCH transport system permease protein
LLQAERHLDGVNGTPSVRMEGGGVGHTTALLAGSWTMRHGQTVERLVQDLERASGPHLQLDLSGISGFDTLGALALSRLKAGHEAEGKAVLLLGATPSQTLLLAEVKSDPVPLKRHEGVSLIDLLEDTGKVMAGIGRDFVGGVSFLGAFVAALVRTLLKPSRFRTAALVKQLEMFGFRSVPIIALISFLVGGIIAQQSVFQLRTFGTTAFVADLLGVLILRELGVLLTAIMIAGRSGSAITAEIGSMKMREEIDALRTMGLDPMEVLIVPRILALIIALPILTFIASMAGLLGGGLVAWVYGDVSPDVFLSRLQNAIRMNTFMVGMIKAPVMALVIGLIASIEGMQVKGSAESLGQQTTASVVKAIFMVIVVDGLFAIFFASIRY